MLWSLTHDYHFSCIKCNIEMSFFNNFEKPHKWIVIDECPKCKYRFEIKRNAIKDYIKIRSLFKKEMDEQSKQVLINYRFICIRCNVEMIFLKDLGNLFFHYLYKRDYWNMLIECPKCKHQVEVKENKDRIKY